MNPERLKQAKENCISLLRASQEKDGGFISLVGDLAFTHVKERYTTFTTSLILLALGSQGESALSKTIIRKGVRFLLREKSREWSWNYLVKNRSERSPFPDDLDDTSLALAALYMHKKKSIDGAVLAAYTQLLIGNEQTPGGPYYTWIVPRKIRNKWQDIDLGVNANVAYFLEQNGISLPNLQSFADKAILLSKYESEYYFSPFPLLYFISKWYKGPNKKLACNFLLQRQKKDGTWDGELQTALAVSALLHFGTPPETLKKPVDWLIEISLKKTWGILGMYVEEKSDSKIQYSGSKTLTTAFIFEALSAFEKTERESREDKRSDEKLDFKEKRKIEDMIIARMEKRIENLSISSKKTIRAYCQKVIESDKEDQVMLLPFHFEKSLGKRRKMGSELLAGLGAANLFGWIAYTIFDDMLDNEGNPADLPLASLCLRETVKSYKKYLADETVGIIDDILDNLDEANRWEREYCFLGIGKSELSISRLPSLPPSLLSAKSLGHALGPVIILLRLGFKKESKEIKNLLSFFRHFLKARQMNDDAHDWQWDLKKGFVNSASILILRKWKAMHMKDSINVEIDIRDLQRIFWMEIISKITREIILEIGKARKILDKMQSIEKKEYFLKILIPIEEAAKEARREREKFLKFEKSYNAF